MSSNTLHQYLDAGDMRLLERVMDRAGYFGTSHQVDCSDAKRAGEFLLKLFQSGVDSEDDLLAALSARKEGRAEGAASPRQVRLEAVNRWADDGGQDIGEAIPE